MLISWYCCLLIALLLQCVRSFHLLVGKLSNGRFTVASSKGRSFQSTHQHKRMTAGDVAHDPDLLSFGNKLRIDIKLPTKDRDMVDKFLRDTEYVVENSWEKAKLKKLSHSTYLVKFISIPIPGVGIITPEIEVKVANIGGAVYIKSGRWSLLDGKGNTLDDPSFVAGLDISLHGQLKMSREDDFEAYYFDESLSVAHKRAVPIGGSQVRAEGFVVYSVKGRKPGEFRNAPAVLLDGTIDFVQKCVSDFVNKQFSTKFAKAFRKYGRQIQLNEDL